jgi:hypothetical protein
MFARGWITTCFARINDCLGDESKGQDDCGVELVDPPLLNRGGDPEREPESRSSLLEHPTLFNLLSCCVREGKASAIKLHTGEIAQIMLPSDWAMCEVL